MHAAIEQVDWEKESKRWRTRERAVYRERGGSTAPSSDLFQYFNGKMIESSVRAIAFSQLTIDTRGTANFIEANFAIGPGSIDSL